MSENSRRPSRGPMGRGRMNGEKAKDFSGAVKKLLRYMSKYKIRLIGMMIFAIVGTVFNIVGPRFLVKRPRNCLTVWWQRSTEPEGLILIKSEKFCCGHWDCICAVQPFPLCRDLS